MAPIWVIPPLCSQVKVPPETGLAAAGVVCVAVVAWEVVTADVLVVDGAAEVVVLFEPQPVKNRLVRRIMMRVIKIIFFISFYPYKIIETLELPGFPYLLSINTYFLCIRYYCLYYYLPILKWLI